MKEVIGNLWTYHAAEKWICITINGFVKKNGTAVMGRGCAWEAAKRYSYLPMKLGKLLANRGNHCYHFSTIKIIAFPTKHVWWDNSDLDLIKKSLLELFKIMEQQCISIIYLPRPGCANGKLDWETQVKPLIQKVFDENPDMIERIIIISKEKE